MGAMEDLGAAGDAFGALLEHTRADQELAPTPCSEWNVRQLVNHVVTGTRWFSAMLRHEEGPDRSLDLLGDDLAAAFRGAFEDFVAALGEPGALEGTYEHRLGPVSGERLVEMRTNEYMVHGWDLAVATGQPAALPEEVAPRCQALYQELLGDRPRPEGGAWAAPVELGEDASALERLVAFFGRDPR
jgi:uncharacterized protein (TIGR03086 family)